MPPAYDRAPRRAKHRSRRKSSGLQSYLGPPSPSAGAQRASLERQYRGLIAQGRKSKYPGTLQIYTNERIRSMSTPQLRKVLQDAYRKPSFK